eukprot:6898416-Pyramimonas_sp.AAC.1
MSTLVPNIASEVSGQLLHVPKCASRAIGDWLALRCCDAMRGKKPARIIVKSMKAQSLKPPEYNI